MAAHTTTNILQNNVIVYITLDDGPFRPKQVAYFKLIIKFYNKFVVTFDCLPIQLISINTK